MFMGIWNVQAEESVDTTCNAVSLNELRTLASNLKLSYVEGTETESSYDGMSGTDVPEEVPYLYIKIYNMTSKLYLRYDVTGNVESTGVKPGILTMENMSDGAITIRQPAYREMLTYTFTVSSDAYGCGNRVLRTMKITLPRFNYYSRLSICQDIPEYYLCKRFVTFDSDNNAEFYTKVNEYKAKLKEQKEKENSNNGIISETISNVSKYKYVVVGIVVAIGVIITVLILRRKRSDKK